MKLSFKFLNRWEDSIFDNSLDKEFTPVSSFIAGTVLVAAFVMLITFFVMAAFYNKGNDTVVIVAAAIIFGIALLAVAGKAFRNFGVLPSLGTKVGYAAYLLLLFIVCACLFTWLAAGFIMIYIFWVVIKAMLGGSNKKKGKIYYNDGSYEEASVEKGVLGETYYTGKDSGNQYVD